MEPRSVDGILASSSIVSEWEKLKGKAARPAQEVRFELLISSNPVSGDSERCDHIYSQPDVWPPSAPETELRVGGREMVIAVILSPRRSRCHE